MPHRIAKSTALAAGLFLLLFSAAGYAERLISQRNETLPTDAWQDLGHLLIGSYLVWMGIKGEGASATALAVSAFFCAAFAGIALYELGDASKGLVLDRTVLVTKAACWLHAILAASMAAGAIMNTSKRQLFYD